MTSHQVDDGRVTVMSMCSTGPGGRGQCGGSGQWRCSLICLVCMQIVVGPMGQGEEVIGLTNCSEHFITVELSVQLFSQWVLGFLETMGDFVKHVATTE